MAAQEPEPQSAFIITVEIIPGGIARRAEPVEPVSDPGEMADAEQDAQLTEVDAGADVTLVARVKCLPSRDLRGLALLIKDDDGSPLGAAEIIEFDGETNTAAELAVRAPLKPGEHSWLAVLPAHAAEGVDYDDVSAPFGMLVKPHATSIVVWDVPTAIVASETFRFKLGVKCSSECGPADWTFSVRDEHGQPVVEGVFGEAPWPGTAALYCAEVEARAPQAEGLHDWTVTAPGPGAAIPHDQQTARFGVRSVRQPECLVSVEAIDQATQAPIKGAKVVIHPYRAFTDEHGRAQLCVPKGTYTILISGPRHVPFRLDSDVTAETSIHAELIVDRAPSAAELWA